MAAKHNCFRADTEFLPENVFKSRRNSSISIAVVNDTNFLTNRRNNAAAAFDTQMILLTPRMMPDDRAATHCPSGWMCSRTCHKRGNAGEEGEKPTRETGRSFRCSRSNRIGRDE